MDMDEINRMIESGELEAMEGDDEGDDDDDDDDDEVRDSLYRQQNSISLALFLSVDLDETMYTQLCVSQDAYKREIRVTIVSSHYISNHSLYFIILSLFASYIYNLGRRDGRARDRPRPVRPSLRRRG